MQANSEPAQLVLQRKSLFWRIHFWAAMIASPFAVIASLTGLLYVFTPQIEAVLHGHLDTVTAQGQRLPLDDSVKAAQAAAPEGMRLKSVMPPFEAGDSVRVDFSPAPSSVSEQPKAASHAGHKAAKEHIEHNRISRNHIVYVDPYTTKVLGDHAEMDRFNMWSKRLHSSLLQGDNWRWMIELSASWLMVMLATGVYLWWPREQSALHRSPSKGRMAWAKWHSWAGVALSVMSLAILLTGLTWSKYAGDQIKAVRDATGQASPSAPKGLKSTRVEGGQALGWEQIWQASRKVSPEVSMAMTAPRGSEGVWRITNFDRSQPTKRFDLHLDAFSAKPLYQSGWEQQTLFGKATAVGIPFHRGEFGWWNQLLLVLFGVGVLGSTVSGWVMFYKRYQSSRQWMPRLQNGAWRSAPVGAWLVAAVLLPLMPLLALSALFVIAMELVWGRMSHNKPVAMV
ncbi:MAG: PepSY domain-containing protein [Brachymonas sp.]|nr:PepSY domain-containing protein [Brachymonas sp.]